MESDIKISVVITAYNIAKYLEETVQSVREQTYQPQEILIVDDGSTDNTREVVKSLEPYVRYYYQENQGIAGARNAGISKTKEPFIAVLDGDDLWEPDKLKKQAHSFEQDPSLDMVFTMAQNFYSPELNQEEREKNVVPLDEIVGYSTSALMIKRSSFMRVGMFSSDYKLGEFIEWFTRAKDLQLKMRVIHEVLMKRRIHTTNIGIRKRNCQGEYLKILREKIKREREKKG